MSFMKRSNLVVLVLALTGAGTAIFVAIAVALVVYAQSRSTVGGTANWRGASPGGFTISSPNEVRKAGQPLLLHTVATGSGGEREFVYFMVIRPPDPPSNGPQHSSSSQGGFIGRDGHEKFEVMVNGRKLTGEHKVTLRPDWTVETESLVIDGKNRPLGEGRVFLVDLSSDPISIVPRDVKLPTTIPDLADRAAIDTLGENTLKDLEQDPVIAEFIRPLR
jgi:hypothetical protein